MSEVSVTVSTLGGSLMQILMAEDIQPGADASYQLCKLLYLYHPLGAKMAEMPITLAQSQPRTVAIQEAPPEVLKAFEDEWEAMGTDALIHNAMRLSRIYGISSLVLGCDSVPADKPIDMEKIWNLPIYFNALDPLNTAGSLVLSQIPTSDNFNRPVQVSTNGQSFHRSRFRVTMNEAPIYLAYTTSAFGFVGRSVYQRALFPLKSFIRTMIADDMIATKLGLLIAKQQSPGSVIDRVMYQIAGIKRGLLKQAQTGNVLTIGLEEMIETLNMQNVDGAGTFARNNIVRNIETAAEMPAKMLDQETMVSGFGEGTEDAKRIAGYIEDVRKRMNPLYAWFNNIVQYRAWSPPFYERIQRLYPDTYGSMEYADAFSRWRRQFSTEWPSVLREPESEQVEVEKVKFEAIVAVVQTLLPELDPMNKALLIEWASDNLGESKHLFTYSLDLDLQEYEDYAAQKQEQADASHEASLQMPEADGEAKAMGRFDSAKADTLMITKMREARARKDAQKKNKAKRALNA